MAHPGVSEPTSQIEDRSANGLLRSQLAVPNGREQLAVREVAIGPAREILDEPKTDGVTEKAHLAHVACRKRSTIYRQPAATHWEGLACNCRHRCLLGTLRGQVYKCFQFVDAAPHFRFQGRQPGLQGDQARAIVDWFLVRRADEKDQLITQSREHVRPGPFECPQQRATFEKELKLICLPQHVDGLKNRRVDYELHLFAYSRDCKMNPLANYMTFSVKYDKNGAIEKIDAMWRRPYRAGKKQFRTAFADSDYGWSQTGAILTPRPGVRDQIRDPE